MKNREPSLGLSLVPLVILVFLLVVNVIFFKDDSSYGPNQIALLLAATIACGLGALVLKIKYPSIEKEIFKSIEQSLHAIVILLCVGVLIAIWINAGVVPTMIYYGLKLISPQWFLPISCIVCCVASLATGSSWSTTGTVGIALIGIGQTLGFNPALVAGTVISGAYFGDKMSPLSDTTNLASAMANVPLFTHIRHMLYTSGPAILISLLAFTLWGIFFSRGHASQEQITEMLTTLEQHFAIHPALFIVPASVLTLVLFKVPALPALIGGCLFGVVASVFSDDLFSYERVISLSYSGYKSDTGIAWFDRLFSRGGMESMFTTICLILMAMIFGGAMQSAGFLQKITRSLLTLVRGSFSLVAATLFSCFFVNMTACDQYLAIILPGRMFPEAYKKYNLHAKNLSRALEDSGTVTSVLIPWNSGGAYHASILGVATLSYAPFCFFNLLSPLISLYLAKTGKTIEKTA